MQYKITKVYVVEANDRHDARRLVAEGETHLKIISIEELKRAGANSTPRGAALGRAPSPCTPPPDGG